MVIMFEMTRGLEYIIPLVAAAVTIAVMMMMMMMMMIAMVLLQCHWWWSCLSWREDWSTSYLWWPLPWLANGWEMLWGARECILHGVTTSWAGLWNKQARERSDITVRFHFTPERIAKEPDVCPDPIQKLRGGRGGNPQSLNQSYQSLTPQNSQLGWAVPDFSWRFRVFSDVCDAVFHVDVDVVNVSSLCLPPPPPPPPQPAPHQKPVQKTLATLK